jgi:hypothetical protein
LAWTRAGAPGVGRDLHHLVGQAEVADNRVMEVLGAGAVDAQVVRRPAGAELVAARRQLADEIR